MIKLGKAGSGTYGVVYNAQLLDNNKAVAVKRNIIDGSINFSGSIKELDILSRLKNHPFIVKLLSVSYSNPFPCPNSPINNANPQNYKDDYIHFIFEQGYMNGYSLIYNKDIPISYLKLSMVQLLLGLEYMHGCDIIHRDLKPSNMLWFLSSDNKATVKICDFGLSKIYNHHEPTTPRVVTCWYRAPEVCVKNPVYDYSIDIWSVGCILYEMVSKKALLLGMTDNNKEILDKIINIIPYISVDHIKEILPDKDITEKQIISLKNKKSFRDMINLSATGVMEFNNYPDKGATYDEFIDLLENCLKFSPKERYTATQLLNHKFFKPYSEIINWCRKNYIPRKSLNDNINITIICCRERAWACKTAFLIFNNRMHFKWYKHKILFQSIDMFDRYIYYLDKSNKKNEKICQGRYRGKYLSRYHTELYYIVCLYMCIKYFTTLYIPISFTDLATSNYKNEQALIEAEEFEKTMLENVLELKIYRNTVFELATRFNKTVLNEYQVHDLLMKYGNIKNHHMSTPLKIVYKYLLQLTI